MRIFTEQDRLLGQQKKIAKQEWAEENLKQDWADRSNWKALAAHYGMRLAPWYIPATEVKYFNKALKAVGKERSWWIQVTGFTKYSDFSKANPQYPAWAIQGLVLETAAEEQGVDVT